MSIPENITDFFYWVKERTEKHWQSEATPQDHWAYQAKWQGLQLHEIETVEKQYAITFSPIHKQFLQILHTLDRHEVIEDEDFDGNVTFRSRPFFYNWLKDEQPLQKALSWCLDTIGDDVAKSGVWLKSWGTKPQTVEEKVEIFTQWYAKAPTLLPLTGHRFVVSDVSLPYQPILSVYGSDIIVYGWDFRLYLLNELSAYLDITQEKMEEEIELDGTIFSIPYYEYIDEVQNLFDKDYEERKYRHLPYWEDMILYYSSGWSSFGKECPFAPKTEGNLRPIVSQPIESEEVVQKTLEPFE